MIFFINDPNELKGGHALVTGGSPGIGGAIVRRLLSVGRGWLLSPAIRLRIFQPARPGYRGDVSSMEGVQAIVEQTSAILGGVDIW
jgi:NAD(P)-dependent dehydrogenase (short-subunit alcohol dehydrogenase family)